MADGMSTTLGRIPIATFIAMIAVMRRGKTGIVGMNLKRSIFRRLFGK
jgi:hypothetical protein